MGRVPEVALAASARSWPDRLHRHVLDHGGARVAGRLLTATQALEASYDVLIIDDICSFLSPGLVARLRREGRQVLGVFDRDDGPDAKRRLLECGIGDVIEADATPDEFLAQVTALLDAAVPRADAPVGGGGGRVIGVAGITAGVGATEIATGLAWRLSRMVDTVLVDLDQAAPGVAQRLDLPPHPNLLTLVDSVVHGYRHDRTVVALDRLRVVPGLAQTGQPLPYHEVEMVLDHLAASADVVVADLGEVSSWGDGILGRPDALVLVAAGDPVGVTRLVRDAPRWSAHADASSMLVVLNRCPRRRFHRGELADQVVEALGTVPLVVLAHDERVVEAAWEGLPVTGGRFGKELGRMASLVAAAVR